MNFVYKIRASLWEFLQCSLWEYPFKIWMHNTQQTYHLIFFYRFKIRTGDIYESIWEGKHKNTEIVFTIRLTGYESIG